MTKRILLASLVTLKTDLKTIKLYQVTMMILLRRYIESKLGAEAPKILKPRLKPTPRNAWQIGRRLTRVYYVLFLQSFDDRPRPCQGLRQS